VQRIEWFKRKFTFDSLPLWMYPNVVERLRGVPARLEDLTRDVPQEILTRRDGDKWSLQEHAGHLLDLEPLGMNRLDDYEAGRETLYAADLKNRTEFVRRLDEYDEAFIQRTALHPRLQMKIRVLDLCFFIAEHDDHHLARISELRRLFVNEKRI
jgi:hypothetical protein